MSIERQIIFIAIFITMLGLVNYYVYKRFFRQLSSSFHVIGSFLILILMAGEIVFTIDMIYRFIPESLTVYMLLSTFVGATFMLFVIALIYDLTVSVSRRVPLDQERRRVIKVIFDTAALFAAVSYLWRGFSQGTRLPEVNDIIVRIRDFPFSGFTIVQLTDLHIGRAIKRDFVEDIIARTNAIHPDMVVITGDLCDMSPDEISHDLEPLKTLNAPAFFVTGNHEYYHGVDTILAKVVSLGIKPLTNESILFGNDRGSFNLVGLNDLTGKSFGIRAPDVEMAYQGLNESKPTIVLSHQPKSISLVAGKRCDLMLSGHTHGGQIFPFGLLVILDQPYLDGLHEFMPGKQIYVSRGTGYWGPPLRVLATSEISRIVITKA
jgi:predicted MPP superfamily phosphohydrolase